MKLSLDAGIKTQRSYQLFKNAINSPRTMKAYDERLDIFLKRFGISDYDTLSKFSTDTIQKILEDYVMEIKQRTTKRSTVKTYVSPVELFLEVNKVFFHKKALHMLYPKNVDKIGNDLPYTTEDLRKFLAIAKKKKTIALIHFFASTGARPAVVEDPILRFCHVTPMPYGCKGVLMYAGSNEEYWGFLTPEASQALDDYVDERINLGEKITQDSPVFIIRGQRKSFDPNNVEPMLVRALNPLFNITVLKNARIERIKQGNRYDKAMFYGFRKRFNTILKLESEVNSNIAEKLMAHNRGLDDVYFKPTKDDCFREFVKAVPHLTISESEKLKSQLSDLQEDKDELVKRYEKRFANTEFILSELLKRMKK